MFFSNLKIIFSKLHKQFPLFYSSYREKKNAFTFLYSLTETVPGGIRKQQTQQTNRSSVFPSKRLRLRIIPISECKIEIQIVNLLLKPLIGDKPKRVFETCRKTHLGRHRFVDLRQNRVWVIIKWWTPVIKTDFRRVMSLMEPICY